MADWAELHPDLLVQIAKRIHLVEDFMAFRGVCTSWRAATGDKDKIFNSWPTVPLLMLAETENNPDREFYSIVRGKVSMRLSLPELKWKKCMEARFGWFLTVDSNGELELFHPFTRRRIELPSEDSFPVTRRRIELPAEDSFPDYDRRHTASPFMFLEIGVLSANPSLTSDFVLMVIYDGGRFLGFWRPGDMSWTKIKSNTSPFSDVNYYNGKFYAIDFTGGIWVWDVSATGDLPIAERLFGIRGVLVGMKAYLVESAGELLVVSRIDDDDDDDDYDYYETVDFGVMQLDLIQMRWSVVTNLGDMSIFVGHNAAFSVDVTGFAGAIKANCIYFSDDCIESYGPADAFNPAEGYNSATDPYTCTLGGGKDMGVYNLGDRKMERFDNVGAYSFICPPVWVVPYF